LEQQTERLLRRVGGVPAAARMAVAVFARVGARSGTRAEARLE